MTHSDQKYDLLLHRVFQYVAVISVLAVLGGGYWYWKQAQAAVEMDDNRPSFEAPLTHDLNLTRGQGVATYSRSDGADRRATVTDFEGLIRPVKNGEARFEGARRVENIIATTSENFSDAAWTNSSASLSSGISDPQGGTSAMRMTATGANGFISRSSGEAIAGRTYTHSIWIRRVTGSGNVILHGDTIGETTITSQVTASWKRFSNTFTTTDGNLWAGVRLGTSGDVVDVAFAQMEEVTGQANQNPSEYVSVGVKTSAPYHGAGVDGVKYFDTENGNTVTSNVVTEATGAAIPTATLKGYLSERGRTNLALRSEECDNASWAKTNATISANATSAPDGRTTADKIVEDTATAQHKCAQSISTTAGSALTFSVYAKKAERHLGVHLWNATDGTFGKAEVNLDTGSIINSTGTTYVEALTGNWYRISITATPTIASSAYILMPHNGSSSNYTGDGSSGVYVWGMQLEQASFVSLYIPTTTASASRGTDTLSYPASGNIDLSKGSFYAESFGRYNIGGQGSSAAVMISHETAALTNTITLFGSFASTVGSRAQVRDGTSSQADISTGSGTLGVSHKHAMRWASNAVQAYFDGSAGTQDTAAVMPSTLGTLYIGNWLNNASAWGNVRNVRVWKKALTDTELNNLTSVTQATSDSVIKKTTITAPDNIGLVGYWSFEDGSGTKAEDFSPSGTNTGTLTNGPVWTDGKIGKAVSVDGVNDYIYVTDPADGSLDFGTGDFSYCFWIKTTDTAGHVVGKNTWSYDAWGSYISSGKVRFEMKLENPPGTNFVADTAVINDGNWHHACGSYDRDGSLSAYSDGSWTSSLNISSGSGYDISNGGSLIIGGTAAYLDAEIDEIRIYNRILTPAEVAILYAQGSTGKTTINASQNSQLTDGLVGLWSFNGADLSGTTAYDRSGQGNNGTLTSGPTAIIGKVGQGLLLDGTNDYVDIADSAAFTFGSDPMTVVSWVNFGSGTLGSYQFIVSKNIDSFELNKSSANTLRLEMKCADDTPRRAQESVASLTEEGRWYHVAATFVPSTGAFDLYVDGAHRTTSYVDSQSPCPIKDSALSLGIGRRYNGAMMKGLIDEVRIYNRALTQAEVSDLYNAGR